MNVLIAGGFWAIAKFMVLLCCGIIFIIRAIYFYIKTCKKWRKLTKILYVYDNGTIVCELNNCVGRGF